jgi:ferredoxin
MRLWMDQDLCTGDGRCTDHCPDLFVMLEDGISYVRDESGGTPSGPAVGPAS